MISFLSDICRKGELLCPLPVPVKSKLRIPLGWGAGFPAVTNRSRGEYLWLSVSLSYQFSYLFHVQIILYGFDPLDAPCDLTRFIDGLLRINEAAQLNDALVSFNTDLE
jgi:hypothetical protein